MKDIINLKILYLKNECVQLMLDTDKITKETIGKTHIEVPSLRIDNKYDLAITSILNWIFFIYNDIYNDIAEISNPLITKENQDFIKNIGTHTSMSVGDIIAINEDMYVCENIGWRKL